MAARNSVMRSGVILCPSHRMSGRMHLTANIRTKDVLICFVAVKPPFLWTEYLNPSVVVHLVFVS